MLPVVVPAVSPTVHALRNEIRVAVGRYERELSTDFTKESLAAICGALDRDVGDPLPSTGEMRATIRGAVGIECEDPERSFRKGELQEMATVLREN
jgi:hypothetical protein